MKKNIYLHQVHLARSISAAFQVTYEEYLPKRNAIHTQMIKLDNSIDPDELTITYKFFFNDNQIMSQQSFGQETTAILSKTPDCSIKKDFQRCQVYKTLFFFTDRLGI
jgi:hypothetical protein